MERPDTVWYCSSRVMPGAIQSPHACEATNEYND